MGDRTHKYLALASWIAREICPTLSVGHRLPATAEICRRYGVSEITVRKAMGLLAQHGLVKRIPKTGTILAQTPTADMPARLGRKATLSVLALQDWAFTGAMKQVCSRYCSTSESVGFDIVEASTAKYEEMARTREFDLVLVNTWWLRQFMTDPALKHRFVPISSLKGLWVDEGAFFPEILRWCKDERNELACWPVNFSTVVNRVAGAAWADSALDLTMDEFASWLTAIRHRAPGACAPFLLSMHHNRWPIVLRAFGAEIFSEDGTGCLLDTPRALEAFEFLTDLIKKQLCMPFLPDSPPGQSGGPGLFAMNRFACCWISSAGLKRLDFPTRLAPLPRGRQRTTQLLLEGIMVGRGSQHTGIIRDFLNFLGVYENQALLSERSDGFSCRHQFAQQLTARMSADHPGFGSFVDSLEYAQPLAAAPRHSAMQLIDDRLCAVWLGVESAANICPALTREVNEHLRRLSVT